MDRTIKECASPICSETFIPVVWNQIFHTPECKKDLDAATRRKDLEEIVGESKKPKILLLDIETSPNLVYTWGLWNQNIGLNQIEETSKVICFSAKWLGSPRKDVMFHSVRDGHDVMIKAAWDLLDQADAVEHYNGTSFDMPHLNREFLELGLGPPKPYQNIDLYRVIKKFKFQSRKLEHVSTQLGFEGKVKHEGFGLWRKCLQGDDKAWREMKKYNIGDVLLMEDVHEILLPWIPNMPNHRLYNPDAGCTRCGSTHMQRRGVRRTAISVFQVFQCQECKGYFTDTSRSVGADYRDVASC
jgi:hypothetical protein